MMKFLKPPVENISVRNRNMNNFPINLFHVTGIEKTTFRVQQDGYWTVEEPIIRFHGIIVDWHFGEHGETLRDKTYDKILEAYETKY